jgi:hypothetical protein
MTNDKGKEKKFDGIKTIPLLTVVIESQEDGDMSINIIPESDTGNVLPANFLDFLCVQIGNFVTGAFHQLREVPKSEGGMGGESSCSQEVLPKSEEEMGGESSCEQENKK